MRLVRRTFLCLVVGVTAFGVSGWLLRPKAAWSTSLRDWDHAWVVPSDCGDEPFVWVWRHVEDSREARAVRAADGPPSAAAVTLPTLWGALALRDGRLLSEEYDDRKKETTVRLLDADMRTQDAVVRLPGRWYATRAGRHAVHALKSREGLACTVVELPSGREVLSRTLDARNLDEACDLASDGRLLAVTVAGANELEPAVAVEVWDLTTGGRVHRLEFPAKERERPLQSGRPTFIDEGRRIECEWHSAIPGERPVVWRLDLERGSVKKLRGAYDDGPPGEEYDRSLCPSYDGVADREAWCAMEYDDQRLRGPLRFMVLNEGRVTLPWRPFPFPLADGAAYVMRRSGRFGGVAVHFVPEADALVWQTKEPPLQESLPAFLHGRLPDSWRWDRFACRTRWYDLRRDEWRDVGLTTCTDWIDVRRQVLYVVTGSSSEGCRLEAYPLPPSDPKPPALAITGVCIAATWWLCARRYRRRARLAAGGAG
jgi:hypothetical protein